MTEHISFTFSPEQRKNLFEEIIALYDLAHTMVDVSTLDGIANGAIQQRIATPFITQVDNAATLLSAHYTKMMQNETPGEPNEKDMEMLESAFCNIFNALKEFTDGVEAELLPLEGKTPASQTILYDIPRTSLAEEFRQGIRAGTLQNKMRMEKASLSPANGKFLVEMANGIGDHSAGLATAMDAAGLIDFNRAVPIFGPSSSRARQDGLPPTLGKIMVDPKNVQEVRRIEKE